MSEVDALKHYGVLGMKWGVRKDERRSSESRTLRKASRKNLDRFDRETLAKRYSSIEIPKSVYSRMSTGREHLPKGSMLKRVSSNPDAVLLGNTFVSNLPEDAEVYKAIIPAQGEPGGRKKYDEFFEVNLETQKKLTGPSEKERIDIFIELLDSKSVDVGPNQEKMTGREYLSYLFGKDMSSLESQELGLSFYNRFVTINHERMPLTDAYFEMVRTRGYNFIADDNNRNLLTKAPSILLSPETDTRVSSVRPLTADEINQAQRNLNAF